LTVELSAGKAYFLEGKSRERRSKMKGRLTCMSWSNAWATAVAMLGFGAMTSPATAQDPEPIVRVEEDWEAVIFEPEPASDNPQFQTFMTPDGASFEVRTGRGRLVRPVRTSGRAGMT
jgi:hypothetical protein